MTKPGAAQSVLQVFGDPGLILYDQDTHLLAPRTVLRDPIIDKLRPAR